MEFQYGFSDDTTRVTFIDPVLGVRSNRPGRCFPESRRALSFLLSEEFIQMDSVAHRHDAELFGYIIEEKVEIGLDKAAPKTYTAGQMFYEKRNVMHSLTRNPDQSTPAKVLIIFIIKNGRPGYTKEYT